MGTFWPSGMPHRVAQQLTVLDSYCLLVFNSNIYSLTPPLYTMSDFDVDPSRSHEVKSDGAKYGNFENLPVSRKLLPAERK